MSDTIGTLTAVDGGFTIAMGPLGNGHLKGILRTPVRIFEWILSTYFSENDFNPFKWSKNNIYISRLTKVAGYYGFTLVVCASVHPSVRAHK